MKRIIAIFILLFCLGANAVQAQSAAKSDRRVFETCCMDSILPTASIHLLQGVVLHWTALERYSKDWDFSQNSWFHYFSHKGYSIDYPSGIKSSDYDSQPLDHYTDGLKAEFKSKNRNADAIRAEKERLVRSLEAMDTLLHNKPLFFATIAAKPYNGNIAAYVDDLYAKSFMCSKKNFKKMMRSPRLQNLQKDLGVNYSIGVALYKLWLKQQAEAADSIAVR